MRKSRFESVRILGVMHAIGVEDKQPAELGEDDGHTCFHRANLPALLLSARCVIFCKCQLAVTSCLSEASRPNSSLISRDEALSIQSKS